MPDQPAQAAPGQPKKESDPANQVANGSNRAHAGPPPASGHRKPSRVVRAPVACRRKGKLCADT
jgi:hypothetical protein